MAAQGLALRIPPITVRLRSPLRSFAEQIYALYRDYELADAGDFADVDIRMIRVPGPRRWGRPQVQFIVDGVMPFDPFPIDHDSVRCGDSRWRPFFDQGLETLPVALQISRFCLE